MPWVVPPILEYCAAIFTGGVIGNELSTNCNPLDFSDQCSDDDDDGDNCDTPLSKDEINRLKRYLGGSEALHKEKEGFGGPPKYFDLYRCRNGDIVVKRKGGGSILGYTGLNINQI